MKVALKSAQFRRERERSWRDLEDLIAALEEKGIESLPPQGLHWLAALYRNAVSSLSVARAISLDRALLAYLEGLVSRAYIWVYTSKRRPKDAVRDFVGQRFPAAVRGAWRALALSVGLMAAGAAAGLLLTLDDPERFYSFVGEMAQGRGPASSTESLRRILYDDSGGWAARLTLFASFLFTHNAKIGILCFALGFAAGAPVVFLLFYNGLVLGSMAAVYQMRGLSVEFWAWVMPHGVTELGAVCLCGAAGLTLGAAILFPGPHTRMENLARRGRAAGVVAIGAVALFFAAALVEGFFRQLVHDVSARWLMAGCTLLLWSAYFGGVGRAVIHSASRIQSSRMVPPPPVSTGSKRRRRMMPVHSGSADRSTV